MLNHQENRTNHVLTNRLLSWTQAAENPQAICWVPWVPDQQQQVLAHGPMAEWVLNMENETTMVAPYAMQKKQHTINRQ